MKDLPNNISALEELGRSVSVPFEQARAMPPSVYTDPDFLKLELSEIFAKEWFCVGRASAFEGPGSYATWDIAGQPIIVLRDADGNLRAMSNVCMHRMSTLLEGRGTTSSIVCPYHAWTYSLDGCLRGAPAMGQNDAFAREDYCLPQIQCEEWLGWVFVSLDPKAQPVADRLSGVAAMIPDYDMGSYTETFFETHRWRTNWKVLAENFMESYHLPVCHAKTIGGLHDFDEMVCPPGEDAFNYHTILKNEELAIGIAHPDNTALKGERRNMTYLFAIYPSLLITLTPGYFWYLTLHPDGVDHVQIGFGGGLSPDFVDDPDAQQHFNDLKTLLDEVNDEDKGCTEKVYRGLCASLAAPGHLSHLERPNFEFARYIYSQVSGRDA